MSLTAPFTGQPAEVIKTTWRAGGMTFTERGAILVSESDRATRMSRTWLHETGFSAVPKKLWEIFVTAIFPSLTVQSKEVLYCTPSTVKS